MQKHVLDIEKYLTHQVTTLCGTDYSTWDYDFQGPPKWDESIGIPLLIKHGKNWPPHLRAKRKKFFSEYHMLDFNDFLDYATSNIVGKFEIPNFPDWHIYYYQAFPGTYDEPQFSSKYSAFSIIGTCISRIENSLWINMQFKVFTYLTQREGIEAVDLVGDYNGFFHEFVNLHLVDFRKEVFPKNMLNHFESKGNDIFSEKNDPVEFTKAHIIPPFKTNVDYYNDDDYRIRYSGQMWLDYADQYAAAEWKPGTPAESIEFYRSEKARVLRFQDYNDKILSDNYEIARLMVHLPSYFDFMYDLVKSEKKKIGVIPQISKKRKGKKSKSDKPIYKIIKSLRVSYEAEEETRRLSDNSRLQKNYAIEN